MIRNTANRNSYLGGALRPRTTGRFIVILREGGAKDAVKALKKRVGAAAVASTADFKDADFSPDKVAGAGAVVFERLGVAVVDVPPEGRSAFAAEAGMSGIIVPEPIFQIAGFPSPGGPPVEMAAEADGGLDWFEGYREGVSDAVDRLLRDGGTEGAERRRPRPGRGRRDFDEARVTWGLQATAVNLSQFTGEGVRVAVLDTGMDLNHPDFADRTIVSQSFTGEPVQDENGHGTHCIGTSCGPATPTTGPRYGIAHRASIYAGKVLGNDGFSVGSSVLFGMEWALANECQVISMSLGSFVDVGEVANPAFEQIGERALALGCLIVAAAGNDDRSPVGDPAAAESVMAISAIDRRFQLASFSNIGLNPGGGQIDVTGPGVDIYSSVPGGYDRFNGTSMATPHVAGIAALHCQAIGERGAALWSRIVRTAHRLDLPSLEVGAGLAQAP